MAKGILCEPVKQISGTINKGCGTYFRVLNGQQLIQACPRKTTPKQEAMRKAFAERYAGKHLPKP